MKVKFLLGMAYFVRMIHRVGVGRDFVNFGISQLSASAVRSTKNIVIGFESKRPRTAETVVNTLVKSYKKFIEEEHRSVASEIAELLRVDMAKLEIRLQQKATQLRLEHGKPLVFADGSKGIVLGDDMKPKIVDVGDGDGQVPESQLLVHDEQAPSSYHHALTTMTYPEFPMPIGVIREIAKESYDHMAVEQVKQAEADKGKGDLGELLRSGMTWRVDEDGNPHHD